MQVETTHIYSLSHPITNEIRYIGKANNLKRRLQSHLYRYERAHKNNWVKSLQKENLIPKMEVLDIVPNSEWDFWEQYWIAQFKAWGFRLVNLTDGGKGTLNISQEVRNKIGAAHKGKVVSQEMRQRLSVANLGKKHTVETRLKMSKSKIGHTLSDASKLKLKIAKSGIKRPPWVVEKVRRVNLGRKNSIETLEKLRKCSPKKKQILQFDLNNNFIREWGSMRDITRKININHSGISRCCNGVRGYRVVGGFIWKFKDINK